MRHNFIRMVIIKKTTSAGEGGDKEKPSRASGGGGRKLVKPPRKSAWQLLKQLNSDHVTRWVHARAHTTERHTLCPHSTCTQTLTAAVSREPESGQNPKARRVRSELNKAWPSRERRDGHRGQKTPGTDTGHTGGKS